MLPRDAQRVARRFGLPYATARRSRLAGRLFAVELRIRALNGHAASARVRARAYARAAHADRANREMWHMREAEARDLWRRLVARRKRLERDALALKGRIAAKLFTAKEVQ
jgi:hypothetical protein